MALTGLMLLIVQFENSVVNHHDITVSWYHSERRIDMATENPTPDKNSPGHKAFTVRIDETEYEWPEEKITGAQLRRLPPTPIPPERDLFQVIPGHPDRKIKDDDTVEVHDGLAFLTAPKDRPEHKVFTIRIDRTEYEWPEEKITGAQLRRLPPTPIPPERDLFQVIPGHPDRKIKDDDTVEIHDGLRFFTAPNTINPGANRGTHGTA